MRPSANRKKGEKEEERGREREKRGTYKSQPEIRDEQLVFLVLKKRQSLVGDADEKMVFFWPPNVLVIGINSRLRE